MGKKINLTDLTYVGDIVLLGDSAETIQDVHNGIDRYAKVVCLRIDALKTKVISTQPRSGA